MVERQHVPSHLVVPTSTPGDETISHGPILVSSTGIVSAVTKSSGRERLLRLESLGSIVGVFHKRRIARGMSSSCQPLSCKALTTSHRIAKLSSTGCTPWETWRSSPSAAAFSSCGHVYDSGSRTAKISLVLVRSKKYTAPDGSVEGLQNKTHANASPHKPCLLRPTRLPA